MTVAVLSDYLENKIIDHIFRDTAYTSPGENIYLALFTSDPSDAGGGTEVSGSEYARIQVITWDVPASGIISNTNEILSPSAGEVWGLVCAVGVFDSLSGGNMLFWGELDEDQQIDTGDKFKIEAGKLDLLIGGVASYSLANALLNHILRNTAYAKPTDVKVHLYTTVPDASDSGGVEVSGGAYEAVSVFGTDEWNSPANGITKNTGEILYPVATAEWGTVVGVGIRDESANLLVSGNITESKSVFTGDTFKFLAETLLVTIQ